MPISISPGMQIIDMTTGKLTREGFVLLQAINQDLQGETSEVVRTDAEQTLTNKTIDGDRNTLQDIPASALKNTTGEDTDVVTGTAGGSDMPAKWDENGDLVEMPDSEFNAKVGVVITPRVAGVEQAFAANGAVATVMSNVGPTGANTAIQEWVAITKVDGTVRYFPLW